MIAHSSLNICYFDQEQTYLIIVYRRLTCKFYFKEPSTKISYNIQESYNVHLQGKSMQRLR